MMPGDDIRMACSTLGRLLKNPDAMRSFIKQRRRALKCVEVCGLPTCGIETSLKTCARCTTVAYCSKAHQTQHWKHGGSPHKKCCFETEY
jgi:hypothetical protein